MDSSFRDSPLDSTLYERLIVISLVVLLHLVFIAGLLLQPELPKAAINALSISFANIALPQVDIVPQPAPKPEPVPESKPQPKPKPEPKLREVGPEAVTEPTPITHEIAAPAVQNETPSAPVLLDAEPDYRADYLSNPRPPYPLVARRMGYQGKVVLNVEVLAEGRAGEVKLQTNSGYDILDQAALQTVKTWKFSPAKRFGQPVTQWFLVPIKFSLEE
ncbi:hypothetical protein UT5_14280 [Ferrigenium sp. UT5]